LPELFTVICGLLIGCTWAFLVLFWFKKVHDELLLLGHAVHRAREQDDEDALASAQRALRSRAAGFPASLIIRLMDMQDLV
jgi:membrane-associated phospholipid phosphatase